MRVIVVGATGNAGTAVLRELHQEPEVTSVVGVARRIPDIETEPYAGVEWVSLDLAGPPAEVGDRLHEVFSGADAVIHLAWLIQPNDRRDLLRRVNVGGTALVAAACARSGVEQLVAASSVGAYSPVGDDRPRDEGWTTGGTRTSHYSVDKAAQEAVLDSCAREHPDLIVTRLRPALIFQSEAGSEIQRYFLGEWVPVQALRAGRLPALPLPAGLRTQAVHARDVARAYVLAVKERAPGAFNIAADDLLRAEELARVLDHGHSVPVPPRLVRLALTLGHDAGLVAADPGWIDMAMGAPVMDCSRARTELGWHPRFTAVQALESLIDGMSAGQGAESVPLRARRMRATTHVAPIAGQNALPEPEATRLSRYLADHLAGAAAAGTRIERIAVSLEDTPVFAHASEVAWAIRREKAFLEDLTRSLGLARLPHRQMASWSVERLSRLLRGRSSGPVTAVPLLETELMSSAVMGKLRGWETLRDHAGRLSLEPETFERLIDDARHQLRLLSELHRWVRQNTL